VAENGLKLGAWRRAKGVSLGDLAVKSRLSLSHLTQVEGGKRAYTQRTLEAVAKALDCSIAELFGEPPSPVANESTQPWQHPEQRAGHYLRAWRIYRGLKLHELAERVEISHSTLSRLERGHIPYTQRTWERLAGALRTDPASLILFAPEMAPFAQVALTATLSEKRQLLHVVQAIRRETRPPLVDSERTRTKAKSEIITSSHSPHASTPPHAAGPMAPPGSKAKLDRLRLAAGMKPRP
jgi:transcriptional regulator with XRE-family HTH domain